MKRRLLIAGNWKMNLTLPDAETLARDVALATPESIDVALFPPFPWLTPVKDALAGSAVKIGAQNCHWEPSGAFTGEVSASMLAGICDFILAGHSERRHVFGESDDVVARKVAAIVKAGLRPILCVGETLDERRAGGAAAVVTRQLASGFGDLSAADVSVVAIAYEPVWAIGTGVAATTRDAQDMCATVRRWLADRFGDIGAGAKVLYGGSMTGDNARELLSQPDVDGGLVGGASLKADSFSAIVAAGESVAAM